MGKTDKTIWVMGDTIYLHECDNCERLLDGEPLFYWEDKDFTLCLKCLVGFTETKNFKSTISARKKQPIKFDLKWEIWERDNFTCQYCGSRKRLSIDHIYPEAHGGTLDKRNLVTACSSCNTKKGARTPEEANMPLISDPRSSGVD